MNTSDAERLAERLFAEWLACIPADYRIFAASSLTGIGNYVDNEWNRQVLSDEQTQMLAMRGVDLNSSPVGRVPKMLQFTKRMPSTSESPERALGIDDSYLFEPNRDPNENLIFLTIIDLDSGTAISNARISVLSEYLQRKGADG